MEYLYSDERQTMIYDALKNIERAIITLQERMVQVHSVDDFLLSPWGMEKLDAACMVLIAIGEEIKTLDKLTDKKLLPTYPSIEWKKVMGVRDVMAHHYFHVDAEEVYSIVKSDLDPLRIAIKYFLDSLFPEVDAQKNIT